VRLACLTAGSIVLEVVQTMETRNTVREAAGELLAALDACRQQLDAGDSLPKIDAACAAALDQCLARLKPLELWGPDNRLPSSELWNRCGHYLARGWLQNQARTKPRGYAGDYEMLARIYEQRQVDDPLGRAFDRYFQYEAAPRAVRNRMRMMADWIVESISQTKRPIQVAVVGSAFGLEVRDALLRMTETARRPVRVVLLDLDPAAIEFARRQLAPLLADRQLTADSANLFRLSERPRLGEALQDSHLIFCPGLFDYLDEASAIAMLRCLYARLAPHGRLVVFQFAPHNPSRAYMEWFGNWYLLYRDASQFHRLISTAELNAGAVQLGSEPIGIGLYASIQRGL